MDVQERLPRFRRSKVRPFQLQKRDYDLVRTIGVYQVVQSVQLERFFPNASKDNLRRRLQLLYHSGYITRPRSQIGQLMLHEGSRPIAYTLAPKGARLVREQEGIELSVKATDSTLRHLKHTLLMTDFFVVLAEVRRQAEHLHVLSQSELLTLAPEKTRRESRPFYWRVPVEFRGERRVRHVDPDAVFAIANTNIPEPRNKKFFFLEIDADSMPVVRARLDQTSLLRKLLTYGATYKHGLHQSRFGFDNMRVLIVVQSAARAQSIIDAFQAHLAGTGVPPRLFLVAARAALQAMGRDRSAKIWRDMEGGEQSVFE